MLGSRFYILLVFAFMLIGIYACQTTNSSTSNPADSVDGIGKDSIRQPSRDRDFIVRPFYRPSLQEVLAAPKAKKKSTTVSGTSRIIQGADADKMRASNARYYQSLFEGNPAYVSDGFDFPVGKPNAAGYYRAQNFGNRGHLGEDWNAVSGGSTDLGDPVYTTSNGLVVIGQDYGKETHWGKVVRVISKLPDGKGYNFVETVYAHLDEIHVQEGQLISRGEQLGTIGDAYGSFSPHLHLEMRYMIDMPLGRGYSTDSNYGHIDPTEFIKMYRPPFN